MSEAHAFLAPSSAGIWGPGGCAAHPRMAHAFPADEETQAAREGTAAHWYLSETAQGRTVAPGALAPNGHPVTDEMIECAQAMIDDIFGLFHELPGTWAIEQRVTMPAIHPQLNWGTADLIAVDMQRRVLHVWDYKFGHRYVDAFENWQLVDYVVGAANFFNVEIDASWTIDARIYQPRSFHAEGPVRKWRTGGERFIELVAQLRDAATAATQPNAPMTTGAHCQDCPARHACPALQRVGGLAIDLSLRGTPHVLPPVNAGIALKMVRAARERLEDMETGLEAQLLGVLRSGGVVPGWEAVQGYGRERWTIPASELVMIGDLAGVDLRKPLEPITPAQARKKGFDEAVISEYSERPLGEVKLKPVEGKSIRKAFQ